MVGNCSLRNFTYPHSANRLGEMTAKALEVEGLHVSVEGREILHGVDLMVGEGELVVVMGPNGSGKSTLANTIMGNPSYQVTEGSIRLLGQDVTTAPPDVRAKAGLFLAFQQPEEISGVPVVQFLRRALAAREQREVSIVELHVALAEWLDRLGMERSFANRYLNEGFSGGEKKRNEIVQMAILQPDVAVLDETDSGLDIDALRMVAKGIAEVRQAKPTMATLVITHYHRLLDELDVDRVHLLVDGCLVATGGPELAKAVEEQGYEQWKK
jgi:Fe-S cluster assembly ATP-binding protein